MNLDLTDKDWTIFDPLFKKRPEIVPETFKTDLERYYLPFINKLVDLKDQKKLSPRAIVGISAIQGAGKTTQQEVLNILLTRFGYSSVYLSIDDHYLNHKELKELQGKDRRYIRRGVTHDIGLAVNELQSLKDMDGQRPILIAGYDKGAHHGEGDRFKFVVPAPGLTLNLKVAAGSLALVSARFNQAPLQLPDNMGADIPLEENLLPDSLTSLLRGSADQEVTVLGSGESTHFLVRSTDLVVGQKDLPNGWHVIAQAPDFIFYDGWMLGARRVLDASIFDSGLPALETEESRQFARDINSKLETYEPLWEQIEFMNVLYVPNYQMSLTWRDQAEDVLRAKGEGMTHDQVREFVYYFWRSVHPAIHIKNLARDSEHSHQVVVIGDRHEIIEVLAPAKLMAKYP